MNSDYSYALGGKLNLFRFFMVRGYALTREEGRFGMIVPLALLADISCASIRRYIIQNSHDLKADCFPQKDNPNRRVFKKAKLSTVVLTASKHSDQPEELAVIQVLTYPWNRFDDPHRECTIRLVDTKLFDPKNTPIPLVDEQTWALCRKIYCEHGVVRFGQCTDINVRRGEINQTIYRRFILSEPDLARLVKGVEIGRYFVREKLSQGIREWFDEKSFLKDHSPREIIYRDRIASQRITGVDERLRIVATVINSPAYFADSTNSISISKASPYHVRYLLGLLNSILFQWRFKLTSTNNNVATNELDSMPFRTIDFSDLKDKSRHDKMVKLVDRMLDLHKQLSKAKTPHDREVLQRQITSTDRQIDRLVYELYELTEEEIMVVEEKVKT